jgi:hypothetical protein
MPIRPLPHESVHRSRQSTSYYSASFNGDHGPIALVGDMKMGRRMIRKEHPDGNAEEYRNGGHVTPAFVQFDQGPRAATVRNWQLRN